MKREPSLPPEPDNAPAKVGLRIAAIAGGFVALIIIIGWLYIASQR